MTHNVLKKNTATTGYLSRDDGIFLKNSLFPVLMLSITGKGGAGTQETDNDSSIFS